MMRLVAVLVVPDQVDTPQTEDQQAERDRLGRYAGREGYDGHGHQHLPDAGSGPVGEQGVLQGEGNQQQAPGALPQALGQGPDPGAHSIGVDRREYKRPRSQTQYSQGYQEHRAAPRTSANEATPQWWLHGLASAMGLRLPWRGGRHHVPFRIKGF